MLENEKDGVMLTSDFRNTPIPAGFVENVDKSPPKAPKAPLMAVERAVPKFVDCEKRTISAVVWENPQKAESSNTGRIYNVFMVVVFSCLVCYLLPPERLVLRLGVVWVLPFLDGEEILGAV